MVDKADRDDAGGGGSLVKLDQISAPAVTEAVYDSQAEAALFERKRQHLELAKGQQQLRQRESYASRTFSLIVGWLGSVLAITLLQGFHVGGFLLSDVAFGSLIGGTTSVLGVLLVILRHLFPGGGSAGE